MSESGPANEQQQQLMQIGALQLPHFVFNSFANGFTPTEINAVLAYGPRPLLTLIMAPTIAKSFALALLQSVEQYETASGLPVPTLQELTDRMAAASQQAQP
jgi:hypothetical protein